MEYYIRLFTTPFSPFHILDTLLSECNTVIKPCVLVVTPDKAHRLLRNKEHQTTPVDSSCGYDDAVTRILPRSLSPSSRPSRDIRSRPDARQGPDEPVEPTLRLEHGLELVCATLNILNLGLESGNPVLDILHAAYQGANLVLQSRNKYLDVLDRLG